MITLAPSRSHTLSPGLGASRSSRYCRPEQPPPITFTRKPSSALPCSPSTSFNRRAAVSLIVIIVTCGWRRSGGRRLRAERGIHHALELATLEHLAHDVAPADELAVDVDLRNRRPVGELLDPLALLRVGQDVHRLERDAQALEHLDRRGGKAALGKQSRALHVDDDLVLVDLVPDLGLHVSRHLRLLFARLPVCPFARSSVAAFARSPVF